MKMKKLAYSEISKILFNAEIESYENLTNEELIWVLKSEVPEERAIAAKLLGERNAMIALPYICKTLANEKEKYISVIMSEALLSLTAGQK